MYNKRFKSILLSGIAAAAAIGGGSAASAATGTPAGTSINNTASVSFTVGGTPQSASSNTATFVVDKKVNLTVAMVGTAATQTSLGATDAVTTFTVTNLTNSVQDFQLTALQQVISLPGLLGADNFDVTNVRVFVDSNNNGVYDAGVDTATYIDELAPDANATVFIVANVPNTAGENTATVELRAQTLAGGQAGTQGALVLATILADTPGAVDTVFADAAGPVDAVRDGAASAGNAYVIGTTTVTVNKSSTVISDPLDGLLLPKAIPGATIKYCIVVHNAGPGIASGMTVADVIPANMTYMPSSITVGGIAIGNVCSVDGTTEDDDAVGADESDPNGGSFDSASNTVRGTLPTLAPLASTTVTFQATVN
jgi:uncharacterized repeat protein (TIGR01451 family)